MNELFVLDLSPMAMTVLRLVAWANVAVAVVWLVVAVLAIVAVACEMEPRHPER